MDKAKQKKAIEFMFVEIDKPIWWQPPALTKAGNDVPTSPDLNPAEAQSIFRLLAEKGLIFPAINERNEPCFLLHSAKKDEWNKLISESRDISWIERNGKKLLKYVGYFIFWASAIFIATYISKNTENNLDSLNKQLLELQKKVNSQGGQ